MNKATYLKQLLVQYTLKNNKSINDIENSSLNNPICVKKSQTLTVLQKASDTKLAKMLEKYKTLSTVNNTGFNAENYYSAIPLLSNQYKKNKHNSELISQSNFLSSLKRNNQRPNSLQFKAEEQTIEDNETPNELRRKSNQRVFSTISHRYTSKEALIHTSNETTKVVKSIDEKIKQLKKQMLHDNPLNLNKLSHYDLTVTTILSFLEERDIRELFQSSKQIKALLYRVIGNNCSKCIFKPFERSYDKHFAITRKAMIMRDSKGKGFNINIVIQCQIKLSKQYKATTIELNSRFLVSKDFQRKEYQNVYRFDYQYDEPNSLFWLMKEDTYFTYDDLSKAYIMPIVPFNLYDSFHITVNLLSGTGWIDFHSFKWSNSIASAKTKAPAKIEESRYASHSNLSHGFQLSDYDLSRYCELELMKTKWLDYSKQNDFSEAIKNEVANYILPLKELLRIDRVEYDDVGYIIVKLHTTAMKVGMLQLGNLGITLIIRDRESLIMNEVRKNGLLFEISNALEIREGNRLVLYLSLNKQLEVVHTIIY